MAATRPHSATYVKLFKDGDRMAIETNADTEDVFVDKFSERLSSLIDAGRFDSDWEFQLSHWLRQFSDVVCKLRGYKSEVSEQRVLIAGYAEPSKASEVSESDAESVRVSPKDPSFAAILTDHMVANGEGAESIASFSLRSGLPGFVVRGAVDALNKVQSIDQSGRVSE